MATPRRHIEEIRRTKFSIGGQYNPLTDDLHFAVLNLSNDLYTKDVHFLMELIQNAEDNEYEPDVKPSLEFVITSIDITGTGAPATLLVFNNEKGFTKNDINAICSAGRSTKKIKGGCIGHKGIGFKSVFLISSTPYIFSNGYRIRFNEEPDPECRIGYIVPEWVDGKPTDFEIGKVYGADKFPNTVLMLPLRHDKMDSTKNHLSALQPELLLFLSKIKQISVHEYNNNVVTSTSLSSISASSERPHEVSNTICANACIVVLSAAEGGTADCKKCTYYLWKQKFPVKWRSHVYERKGVENWEVQLAFPLEKRLRRGNTCPGIYAYMPTEMTTNFPFIIQADFFLTSSRESILLDNNWNKGILECIPTAFVKALSSFAGYVKKDPRLTFTLILEFLPVLTSQCPTLEITRQLIKDSLMVTDVLPCEPFSDGVALYRPAQLGRLLPAFWHILNCAKEQRVNLETISSHGKYILHSSLDHNRYNNALDFLGVGFMTYDWYGNCIKSCNLIMNVSEDVYLEFLSFLAQHWSNGFSTSSIKNIPVLKYIDHSGKVNLCSLSDLQKVGLQLKIASISKAIVHTWRTKLKYKGNFVFLPETTRVALKEFQEADLVKTWMHDIAGIEDITVYAFCQSVSQSLRKCNDRDLVITFTHIFSYH